MKETRWRSAARCALFSLPTAIASRRPRSTGRITCGIPLTRAARAHDAEAGRRVAGERAETAARETDDSVSVEWGRGAESRGRATGAHAGVPRYRRALC